MATIRFDRRTLRCCVLVGCVAAGTAQAQVTERVFANGFETRNTQVFAGVMQESPFFGGIDSYGVPNGRSDAYAGIANTRLTVDRICEVGNFIAQFNSTDATYTATTVLFNVNGVDSGIGCNVSNALPTCTDALHKVGIGPNDSVSIKVTPHLPSRPITNDDTEIRTVVRFGWTCKEY